MKKLKTKLLRISPYLCGAFTNAGAELITARLDFDR